ncbi:hypothetical protein [Umezawaea sp. Da 62-37]|uniref:hypothetical protein n=1 Tax=Umezawaea sp. Da 62-37 TaxID=3075927 RepID=UPI0028F728AF|nr:hypothetical protein [Umezawaea sp. Da 62-37]WNV89002.1 hypothetical protein RM788_12060 [Umezawaea sp. Da 62-37]
MTHGSDRWAKYGKLGAVAAIVTAIVVGAANVDGFLSFVERFTGTATTTAALPQQTQEAGSTGVTPTGLPQPEEVPNETAAAQPSATAAVRSPVETPTTAAAPPKRAGALIVTIKMGSGGKIGPSEYRAGSTPGANVDVYDDAGQLSSGCYPSWSLTRGGTEVLPLRNTRCTSGGITMFNFKDSLDSPGDYRLQVDIRTDGGQTGSSFVDFVVR